MMLIERHGFNEHKSEKVTICGKESLIHDYDWYMEDALRVLRKIVCKNTGEIKAKYKSVTYEFVNRFRDAIRENHNHGHHLPTEHLRTFSEVKFFMETIERVEEADMKRLTEATPVADGR